MLHRKSGYEWYLVLGLSQAKFHVDYDARGRLPRVRLIQRHLRPSQIEPHAAVLVDFARVLRAYADFIWRDRTQDGLSVAITRF